MHTSGPLNLRWHWKALEQEVKGMWRGERDRSAVLSDYTCWTLTGASVNREASAGLDSDEGLSGCEVRGEGCLTQASST